MSKSNAIEAIQTAIKVNRAARSKLEIVIAQKKFMRKKVDKERAEKAALNRKIGHLRDVLVELEAATTVTGAPSPSEIREVNRLIKEIKDLAVEDAMAAAGLNFIKTALAKASELRGKVKV